MNIGEANELNALLNFVLGEPAMTGPITAERACEAAAFLADKASRALHAGYSGEQVRAKWADRPDVELQRCGVMVSLQGLGEYPCVVVLDGEGGHDGDCIPQPERDGIWPPRGAPDCPAGDPDCEGAAQLDPATASHVACEPPRNE